MFRASEILGLDGHQCPSSQSLAGSLISGETGSKLDKLFGKKLCDVVEWENVKKFSIL